MYGTCTLSQIREDPETGPFVEGLSRLEVSSHDEIYRAIESGNAIRTVAATAMNAQSSRSHAVFTIVFTQTTAAVSGYGDCTSLLLLQRVRSDGVCPPGLYVVLLHACRTCRVLVCRAAFVKCRARSTWLIWPVSSATRASVSDPIPLSIGSWFPTPRCCTSRK